MGYTDKQIRDSFINWIIGINFHNPLSVTLCLWNGVRGEFQSSLHYFQNRLNQKLLGNRFRRFRQRHTVIPVIESVDDFPHYHLILDNHTDLPTAVITSIIHQSWNETPKGFGKDVDVREMYGEGWVYYISKYRTKTKFDESIDWVNCYIRD